MSARRWLLGLCLIALAAGLTYWLATHLEHRVERLDRGFVGEARRNPYLACEHFLRRMGVPARSLANPKALDKLPPADETILIPTERATLGEARSRALLDWVKRGGHLIVRVRHPIKGQRPAPDPLLDPLGVHGRDLGWENVKPGETTKVDREPGGEPMEVAFRPTYVLDTDGSKPIWEIHDARGTRLVQIGLGKGRITVLSDTGVWENARIGDHSHARLLFVLAAERPRSPVLILASDDLPPLWRWLWERVPAIVISAALLLLAWLAQAPGRFGPLRPEPEPRRRALLEHIEATGHFLWRQGGASELEEATRQALLRRLRRHHPQLARAPGAERARRLAELSGLGPRLIRSALDGEPIEGRDPFTRRIQVLETLRRHL